MTVDYPDIAPLLAAKQARRQALAALSWEEKVAIIDHMRHLLPREGWRVTTASPQPNPKDVARGVDLAGREDIGQERLLHLEEEFADYERRFPLATGDDARPVVS